MGRGVHIKKSIYKITNTVNDKVYIGQTSNMKRRWREHCNAANEGVKTPLYEDMRKYGIVNFQCEVVEADTRDYNEREQYYIEQCNTLYPNGYNRDKGGRSRVIEAGDHIEEIIEALQNSEMNMQSIAKFFRIGKDTLNRINLGKSYPQEGIDYPIRDNTKPYNLTQDRIKQIHYSLKYELDKSLRDIEEEYRLTKATLYHINYGDRLVYRLPGNLYPLRDADTTRRKLSPEAFREITALLKDTDLPMQKIARRYNISASLVGYINDGTASYCKDEEQYPLRSHRTVPSLHRTCFSPDEIRKIEHDLRSTSLTLRQIADKNEVAPQTVANINAGKYKKYYDADIDYPIRPIKRRRKKCS